jgi:phosphoribosyl 1,2-cyclic phosphodiesterase
MELCVLASGSAGNVAVVRTAAGVMLIDAGIGPRTTAARLKGTGVSLNDVSAICLTHLDSDHFRANWAATIVEQNIRVFCHAKRIYDLFGIVRQAIPGPAAKDLHKAFFSLIEPFDEVFAPLPDVLACAVPLSHDREGSHGFVISGRGVRIGYATDLGNVPARLLEAFDELDVLAIESNYDPRMQRASGRPLFLQRRITGGRGHLSNEQAFDAVRTVFDRSQRLHRTLPAHVVLLHRSRECNCPVVLRQLFNRDVRIDGRLTLGEQFHRSPWLGPTDRPAVTGEQLMLSLG